MKSNESTDNRKMILSTLWIFYTCNILYADVLTLMGSMRTVSSDESTTDLVNTLLTPEMLLVVAFVLEMALVMVILSRILKYGLNRWLNIIVGIFHTLVVCASLFVEPTIYYIFFATIEIATLLFIVWYAWTWSESKAALQE